MYDYRVSYYIAFDFYIRNKVFKTLLLAIVNKPFCINVAEYSTEKTCSWHEGLLGFFSQLLLIVAYMTVPFTSRNTSGDKPSGLKFLQWVGCPIQLSPLTSTVLKTDLQTFKFPPTTHETL